MSQGGQEAVPADQDVVAASEVRRLEERVPDPEREPGRKTMEVEILKGAPLEAQQTAYARHERIDGFSFDKIKRPFEPF